MTRDSPTVDRLIDCLRQLLRAEPDSINDANRLRSGLLGRVPEVSHGEIDTVCRAVELGIAVQMRELPPDMPVDMAITRWLEQRLEADREADIDTLRSSLELWADALDCDVRSALTYLIADDSSFAFDAVRCRKALLEVCPSRPFLVSLLVSGIDSGIVHEIEKLPDDPTVRGAVLSNLEKRLTDAHHREGTGRWTLHSWLLALGHQVDRDPVEAPSDLPWNLFTEVVACLLLAVLLAIQLFRNVWACDDLNRYWFGIENVWWAMGTAVVVAGSAGLFASSIHKHAWHFSGFPDRRTGPGWIRRQTFLSVLYGMATAWMMLLVERYLPVEWNTPVGCLVGVVVGLAALWSLGKGASILLLTSYVLVWFIYAVHWLTMWEYDPEHVCLLSNAPGVDGYFVFFVGVAGLSPTLLAGYWEWRAWKKLPASHFLKWPVVAVESGPCVAPGGRHFANWDSAGNLTIGDTSTRSTRVVATGHHAAIADVAFSADGDWIATASQDISVRVISVADGTVSHCLTGHCQTVTCLAWSPDSRLLAAGSSDHCVRVWDVTKGECLHMFDQHRSAVSSLCFASSDRLISGDKAGALRAWSIGDGQQTHHIPGKSAVETIQFIEVRREIAVRRSDGLEVLDAASLESVARIAASEFKNDVLTDSAVVVDQQCLLISTNESLIAWDYVNGERRTLSPESPGSIAAARMPDESRSDSNSEDDSNSEVSAEPTSHVAATTGTLLLLNGGRQWRQLDAPGGDEEVLQRLTLSVCGVDESKEAGDEPAGLQDNWEVRFDNWLNRRSERPSWMAICFCVGILMLGFIVVFRLTGLVVAGASTFAAEWLRHDSYVSMLDPLGAWNEELRTKWFDAQDQGETTGTLVGAVIVTLLAVFLIRADRWARAMTLQCAQFGTLAAVRWCWPVPLLLALPLTYEDRHSLFECLQTGMFVSGPIMLFCLMTGWSIGGLCGAVRATVLPRVTRGERRIYNELTETPSRHNEDGGMDWLLATCIIVGFMTGLVTTFGFVAGPVLEYALLPVIFQLDGSGTASGRGRATMADEEGPPDAIPVEEILQAFHDNPDAAADEYVGYTFAIRGYLLDRVPVFTLTPPHSTKVLARCEFAAEDAARVQVNSFPESLVEGQRVIVFGKCEGIDSQGLLFFSESDVHWRWTFHPEEFERRSPVGSAGPPERHTKGDD